MKIRTLKDNVFDIEKNAVAQILLDAGLITIVPPFVPKLTTTWFVGIDVHTGKKYIEASRPGERLRFSGPNAAKQMFKGEAVPAEIAAEFARPLPQNE